MTEFSAVPAYNPLTGKAQQAQLHGDAEPVRITTALPNQRQIGLAEGVVSDEFVFGVG
jgi:hypothetical protein